MAKLDGSAEASRSSGLFAAAFVLALVVLALLGHFGLPDAAIGVILTAVVFAAFLAAAFGSRTMDATAFFVANRGLSAPGNGMATAAAFMSAGVYLGLAGAFFDDGGTALALIFGWSLGFLLMAVLIAPYFRRSGAFGVAGFLTIRYGGRTIRLAAVAMIVASLTAALASALAAAAWIETLMFGLDNSTGLGVAVVITAAVTILGGMRSLTSVAILQYLALAVAFLVPAALVAATRVSMPIPQLGFGFALQEVGFIAATTGQVVAGPLPGKLLPAIPPGAASFVTVIASLAAGIAALPHLVMRGAAMANGDGARRAAGWALVFILVVALAAPTYAALAKLGVLTELAGLRLLELPGWVFEYGRRGLLQICAVDADSSARVVTACAATDGAAGTLRGSDFAIGRDALVTAWPAMLGLPPIATALLGVGALSAILAACGALTIAVANALGHDLFGRLIAAKSSAGRRLIVTRILIVVALLVAARIAVEFPDDVPGMANWSVSLAAGGLFPAVVLAVWWRRANAAGAIAGMIAGFGLTLAMLIEHRLPGTTSLAWLDVTRIGLSSLSVGFFGALAGAAVTAAVSLMTPRPTPKRLAVLDAIRRPGGLSASLGEAD